MEIILREAEIARMVKKSSLPLPRESHPKRVGPRITALREALAMSRAQLADAIGLDRSTLTKVEKGELGLAIAMGEKIAVLYGFGLDFIYRGDIADVPDRYRPRLLVEMVQHRAM